MMKPRALRSSVCSRWAELSLCFAIGMWLFPSSARAQGFAPTCELAPGGTFSVAVGDSLHFTVTGASTAPDCDGNGIPDACDPDCNGNGVADACDLSSGSSVDGNANGVPDECEVPNASAVVQWPIDGCSAPYSAYSEFIASVSGGCPGQASSGSTVFRAAGGHSCTDDRDGNAAGAICVSAPDLPLYVAGYSEAVRFSVVVQSPAALSGLSFWELAPETFVLSSPQGSSSGPNDPPTLFGLRVLRDGVEVHRIVDLPTSSVWHQHVLDFTMDPDFVVTTGSATFEFELLPYSLAGAGGAMRAWDLDDLQVTVTCDDCDGDGVPDVAEVDCEPDGIPDDCEVEPDCDGNGNGEALVLSVTGLPTGALMSPSLPTAPQLGSVSSAFEWTPVAGDEGTYTVTFTVTDGADCLPTQMTQCVATLVVTSASGSLTVSDPVDVATCVGGAAVFSVIASGTPPISYQWRRDGVDLTGATGASLVLDPVALSDAGSYLVQVMDANTAVSSAPALLSVETAPVIDVEPLDSNVCMPATSLTLSVTASGTPPLAYQWRLDGLVLPGATGSTLTIPSFDPTVDVGSYDVIVSNACGSAPSAAALVTAQCSNPFVRGDCKNDGHFNIADPLKLVRVLFTGLPFGTCVDACDSNDDGVVDLSDIMYSLAFLFEGAGPAPTSPFPLCGVDPTGDTLDCPLFACP